jgi:hypothetical protein
MTATTLQNKPQQSVKDWSMSANSIGDEPEDEARLQVERRLRLARLKRKLREIRASQEARSADQSELQSRSDFQATLRSAVDSRLKEWNIPEPANLDSILHEWVTRHWDIELCDFNLGNGIPLNHINSALKAVYNHEYETAESHEEVVELRKNSEIRLGPLESLFPALKRGSEIRTQRRQHRIQKLFTQVSVIFTACAALFMFCMLLIGCFEMARAVTEGIFHSMPGNKTLQHDFLLTSLSALEIILVAPLPYLLVLALNRYIKALAYQERTDEFRRELLEFKAFEVALFIAIIAATSVSNILDGTFDLKVAIPVSILIGILSAYYFIIEKACREAVSKDKND